MVRPTVWDSESLFLSGDEYFKGLIAAIHSAQKSVEFETYIFEDGVLARRLIAALSGAAQRGLRVQLIVDGWGSPGFVRDLWPSLRSAGVAVRFFRVSPHILQRLPGDPRSFWHRVLHRWRQVNRGNHRKFCLVDGISLWVGSFNVSDVHLEEITGPQAWKDIGVLVQGSEVRFAHRAFRRAYRGWTALNFPMRSPRLLLLNDSFIHKRRTRLQSLDRIKKAKYRIWLATPYFVPIGSVFRRLAKKSKKGVDVRLMVPRKNDVWFMKWISWPLLHSLHKKGVRVFIYQPRFSHQKLFIVDDWICIGSTNLNHRSFLHDLEMDVVLTHNENKAQVVENFLIDQRHCRPYDPEQWTNLPRWKRILSSVFLLARYWS